MNDAAAHGVPLINTRTTFQRLSDARFFTGFVKRLRRNVVAVVCLEDHAIQAGDRCAFHVYGAGKEALFFATFKTMTISQDFLVREYVFVIEGEMTLKAETQSPRFATSGLVADIQIPGDQLFEGATVSDISSSGLGLIAAAYIRKGDSVDLTIHGKGEAIHATAQACYCVRPKSPFGVHRIGFKLTQFDRISSIRWQKLYAQIVDASRYVALSIDLKAS